MTDHSAVKAVLETPNPTGKHARWWTRVYGRGVKEVRIIYHTGRENVSAHALSRKPHEPAPLYGIAQDETQVAAVNTMGDEPELLQKSPVPQEQQDHFATEKRKDPVLKEMMDFLHRGTLLDDLNRARKLAAQQPLFPLMDGILYYIDAHHGNCKRVVVPSHLRVKVLQENHHGLYSGHFSGNGIYNTLVRHWWWPGMHVDAMALSM